MTVSGRHQQKLGLLFLLEQGSAAFLVAWHINISFWSYRRESFKNNKYKKPKLINQLFKKKYENNIFFKY